MPRPRILLADDHRLVVEACVTLLEPECEVVGIVTDGRALLPKAIVLRPDVIVLDIGMPLLNGLDAGRQIKHAMPVVKLIFLTMNEDPDLEGKVLASECPASSSKPRPPASCLRPSGRSCGATPM